MSNHFFAKYIIVPGEIKLGDKFFDEHIGEIFTHQKPGTLNAGDKKVKLFLISKDIKIGDKVWWEDPDSGQAKGFHTVQNIVTDEKGIDDDCIHLLSHTNSIAEVYLHEVFKVIGEISRAAIWVKEWDIFYEYEEWWFKTHELESRTIVSPFWKYSDGPILDKELEARTGIFRACKVKCPACDRFH